jgi:hypothetical protein
VQKSRSHVCPVCDQMACHERGRSSTVQSRS